MEYWTVMWITMLSGEFDGKGFGAIIYKSLEQCEAALSVVGDTLPYDHNLFCEETTTPSSSMRPQPNPFY